MYIMEHWARCLEEEYEFEQNRGEWNSSTTNQLLTNTKSAFRSYQSTTEDDIKGSVASNAVCLYESLCAFHAEVIQITSGAFGLVGPSGANSALNQSQFSSDPRKKIELLGNQLETGILSKIIESHRGGNKLFTS